MKSDKKQSLVMVGIVLLIVAGIMMCVSFSAPRVYENKEYSSSSKTALTTEESTEIDFPLDLNTATAEELAAIDGISGEDAYAIVKYREKIGKYTEINEIMNIKGIGKTKYNKLLPYVVV